MQHIRIKYVAFILIANFFYLNVRSQGNTGIGTTKPHPSAILEITDSARGVLIPRTDTLSILDYVNTLNPNPGIADGLLIFDTILNTYLYYDEDEEDWKALIDLVGPRGLAGPRGPLGPRGDTGMVNDWRDSAGFDKIVLGRDTCNDWFINSESGEIQKVWCDTLGGLDPPRWRDTTVWSKPVGKMMAPSEKVYAFSTSYGDLQFTFIESMANDSALVVMKDIPGLSFNILIEPDEVAYVWVAAYGTVGKAFAGNDLSYAQYDLTSPEFYRSTNRQNIFTVGPNNAITGRADLAGWSINGHYILYGDLTDPIPCRCFTPYQNPFCSCSYGPKSLTVGIRGGNRYSGSANTSFLILADGPSKETTVHFNVLVVVRRSPFAQPHLR